MTTLFFLDESCAGPIVRALQAAGYDIVCAEEAMSGADDRSILEQAVSTGRVLVTQDRDFGELTFAEGMIAIGVIRINLRGRNVSWSARIERVLQAFLEIGDSAIGANVTIEWTDIRVTSLPNPAI